MAELKIYMADDFQHDFPVSDEIMEKLHIYHDMLIKWQKAINLVSPATLKDIWRRHILDSAQIAHYLPQTHQTLVDLGSGAGFPGLVLAILKPTLNVKLVESDERKCQFLRAVSRETDTPVSLYNARIDTIANDLSPDFVTARALANLKTLFDFVLPWAMQNPVLELCFLKGTNVDEEIKTAQEYYNFDLDIKPSITDRQAKFLRIRKLRCA